MADLQLLLEAEKRGILPPDRVGLLNEARKRGLIPNGEAPAQLPAQIAGANETLTKIPDWARRMPELYGIAGAAREVAAPFAEAAGLIGGAVLGAPAGPLGSVAGAGLGYGIGKQAVRVADVALGNAAPESAGQEIQRGAKNVLEGAALESGGQLLSPVIGAVVKGGAKAIGKTTDIFRDGGKLRAAEVIRKSLGPEFDTAVANLRGASSDISAGQVLADVNSPVTQALLARALERDPRFMTDLLGKQEAGRFAQLSMVAKASDQTAAKQAQKEMKDILNKELIPVLETELSAANLAGQMGPKLKGQADRFAQAAASKVEDVRRFTAASNRAPEVAPAMFGPSGAPIPARYTYVGGDLAKRAEQVATEAAEGSLRFGEAAQFANAGLRSLEAHGLKPLKTQSIVSAIEGKLADPAIGPNKDVQKVLNRVIGDISEWTNSGGVIDAWALDTIRKSSVNQAARDVLGASADPKAVKELASKMLTQIKPLIVDAVESAGGTGYGAYLKSYSEGMQKIGQTKLGAEAMRLYQTSPKKFIELIEGNSPKAVEKVFGSGNYDLAKQMSQDAMKRLGGVAGEVKRDLRIADQIKAGEAALNELLDASASKFQIPNVLNPKIAMANRGLRELEKKIGKDAMNALTEASKSGRALADLLETLPTSQKNAVLKALSNPQSWLPKRNVPLDSLQGYSLLPTMNALAPSQNALVDE